MKTKYRNGLNATPDIMIIHLSSIKPDIFKMRWEEAKAQLTLTKHLIVSNKQDNLGTHLGLQII